MEMDTDGQAQASSDRDLVSEVDESAPAEEQLRKLVRATQAVLVILSP